MPRLISLVFIAVRAWLWFRLAHFSVGIGLLWMLSDLQVIYHSLRALAAPLIGTVSAGSFIGFAYLSPLLFRFWPLHTVTAWLLGFYLLSVIRVLFRLVVARNMSVATPVLTYVVSWGPYRLVRHPLAAVEILSMIVLTGLFFSAWNVGACLLSVVLQVIVVHLEDSFLQSVSGSYGLYAGRVRFRLLPGVW